MTNQRVLGESSLVELEWGVEEESDTGLDGEATDINQVPETRWRPNILSVSQMVLKTCILLSPPFWS